MSEGGQTWCIRAKMTQRKRSCSPLRNQFLEKVNLRVKEVTIGTFFARFFYAIKNSFLIIHNMVRLSFLYQAIFIAGLEMGYSSAESVPANEKSNVYDPKSFFNTGCGTRGGPGPEGDKRMCYVCRELLTEKYPLSAADFERSFTPGETCYWRELAKKWGKEDISIAVLGGSMTFGHSCVDKVLGQWTDCAWASRLEKLLINAGITNVKVDNRAMPMHNYENSVATGYYHNLDHDLILIDFSVNTYEYYFKPAGNLVQMHDLDVMLQVLRHHNPTKPIMKINTFDRDQGCSYDQKGGMNYNISGEAGEYQWCAFGWQTTDSEMPLLKHYKLPMASYRDAIWPDMANPRSDLPCLWNGGHHPDANAHHLLADTVFYSLNKMLDLTRTTAPGPDACPPTKPFFNKLKIEPICADFGYKTHMDTKDPNSFTPVYRSPDWYYGEDSKGKPGWIIHLKEFQENSIEFEVEVSPELRVEVTFLSSYEHIGSAELSLHPQSGGDALITTKSAERHLNNEFSSFPWTQVLYLPKDSAPGKYRLKVKLLNEGYLKFKLLWIASC